MISNIMGTAIAAILAITTSVTVQAQEKPTMTAYKNPWCGCCKVWADAMVAAGYKIKTVNLEDLSVIKRQAGVPEQLNSCHTVSYGKYVLEGHVPLQAIRMLDKSNLIFVVLGWQVCLRALWEWGMTQRPGTM